MLRAGSPFIIPFMVRGLRLSDAAIDTSLARIARVFEDIGKKLEGRRYLVGNSLSAARLRRRERCLANPRRDDRFERRGDGGDGRCTVDCLLYCALSMRSIVFRRRRHQRRDDSDLSTAWGGERETSAEHAREQSLGSRRMLFAVFLSKTSTDSPSAASPASNRGCAAAKSERPARNRNGISTLCRSCKLRRGATADHTLSTQAGTSEAREAGCRGRGAQRRRCGC